ncbi:TPA: hypothetical protein NPP60_005047 [Klebsiella variicola subsp. variicola]|nr:hypothetical protein [Klebsiella variicola subsp. variicola]
MNKDTVEFIRAVCKVAIETVNNATLKGAKEKIEASTVDAPNAEALEALFKPAIANRTKAGFIAALDTLLANVEKQLAESNFNERVAQVMKRAQADYGIALNEFEVAAAIRSMPFFSYSAVLQMLREAHQSEVATPETDLLADCLRAGATPAEAKEYARKHGDKALEAFLAGMPLKRMRFHYFRISENPSYSEADREFVGKCLLKVARRYTHNKDILDLFNDLDSLVMGEVFPAGAKRKLIEWALVF